MTLTLACRVERILDSAAAALSPFVDGPDGWPRKPDHPADVLRTPFGWSLICSCGAMWESVFLSGASFEWAGHHNAVMGVQR